MAEMISESCAKIIQKLEKNKNALSKYGSIQTLINNDKKGDSQ